MIATQPIQKSDVFKKLLDNIGDVGSRVKILENRYNNLGKKMELTDQNLIESEKTLSKEVRLLNQDILDVKKRIEALREKMDLLGQELSTSAKSHDLKVIEKYVEMWQPLNFVTKDELKRAVKEKI